MARYRSEFLRALAERGYIHQGTDEAGLDALAAKPPITGYIGFDLTAPSLHVGSLVQIMMLRWLQKTGHKPIVLIGSGTTKIGDPSGRDESRQLLSDQAIAANRAGIEKIFRRFLAFGDGPSDALMVDNADWLDELNYIAFLRDYGRHFSVNRMLGFESVKLRLEREQPLTFLEFNYMVLQAYDFLELARRYDCVLQMGGSDQWGNIVNGVELSRRIGGRALYGLTTPLITTASGAKMGKTAQGAVWLNAEQVSPYHYYQYWRNTDDGDGGRFLRLFTYTDDCDSDELSLDEIKRLERLRGAELNEAKDKLAYHATRLCHGREAAEAAARAAMQLFGGEATRVVSVPVEAASTLPLGTIPVGVLPALDVPRAELEAGIPVFELFYRAKLAASGGEARRLIRSGGARLNDQALSDELQSVTTQDVTPDGVIKLSAGRKRHALVRPA